MFVFRQYILRLFDDAAYKLNLKALLGFLNALCAVSQKCLFSLPAKRITKPIKNKSVSQTNLSLLHRVGGVMLKCIRSGRPLIHVMQVWSIIGLHLMEVTIALNDCVFKFWRIKKRFANIFLGCMSP